MLAKRITVLLLAALLLCSALASCGAEEKGEVTAAQTTLAATDETVTTEDQKKQYDPTFAPQDYGGYEFHILINGNDLEPNVDYDAEELNGEALNDAIYTRDYKLEEKYNVKFNVEFKSDDAIKTAVSKSNSAGDAAYDLVEVNLNFSLAMAAANALTPIDELPNVDLTKPYWNQITLEGSSVRGKNYFAYSDTNIHAFGATPCAIFNKKVLESNNLGDIYALVTDGLWTTDRMSEMISAVTHDINGDGTLDKDDYWGLICNNFAVDCLVSGTGYKMLLKDDNDLPTLNVPTEKFYAVLDGVGKVLSLENGAMLVDRTSTQTEAREYWPEHAITEDRALFWIGNLKCVERLRGMETDFGIVPMPKLDETQENYAVHRQANIGATTAVPLVLGDADMVGKIVEDMAYMSYKDVMPVYMDSVLEGKYFRDPESSVTLQIMRQAAYCDMGFMSSNFGISILSSCREIITSNKDAASTFAKVETKFQKSLDKMIAAFDELNP